LIDVVIPVHNALDHFKKMVESLYLHTRREDYRLIIVDDASDGETKKFIEGLDCDVRVENNKQLWFTRAVNIGLDNTTCSLIAALNTDIVLCEGWLGVFSEYFKDEKVMLAGSDYQPPRKGCTYPTHPDYVTGHCWMIRRWFLEEFGTLDEKHAHIDSDRHFSYEVNNRGFKVVRNHSLPIIHGTGPSWGRQIGKLPKASTLPPPNNRKLGTIST